MTAPPAASPPITCPACATGPTRSTGTASPPACRRTRPPGRSAASSPKRANTMQVPELRLLRSLNLLAPTVLGKRSYASDEESIVSALRLLERRAVGGVAAHGEWTARLREL